ncbi:MAG TPA: type ISP restriction/modification enzyme [Chthoniobacterales bacterium]|nr:type ISP restriction/modification enzyme [Chthoniobacterales bacterium]
MRTLPLKANDKRVVAYQTSLAEFEKLGIKHETAVRAAFQALLEDCTALVNKGRADKWKLVPEFSIKTRAGAKITPDGALLDSFRLMHGLWEAKDTADDLDKEIRAKFKLGYPRDNILFQSPHRAVLVQDGERAIDVDITKADSLVAVVKGFFEYRAPAFDEWERAVAEFKERLPEIGREMTRIIRAEYKSNKAYTEAFDAFVALCRQALNPNLAVAAVEEMLIQHILTERIFRKIFDVGEFMQRNNIAAEIEKVVIALTSRSFSRDKFLKELDRFYVAIEDAADTIPDFSEKQKFLNTVYEQFFQGFAVTRADTLGIVYTPQAIVDFMLASVEEILKTEFGRALGDAGVHVIDPFVGTGNFMVNLIRRLPKTQLEHKYRHELHCNEVMLLPYYVAAMNIEHTFYEQIGRYEAFPGICLVDTFETAEKAQAEFGFFNVENTERVKRQKAAPIFVVLGNPPYNAWQQDENDNNKNRKYEEVDRRVRNTYGADSVATLQNSLADPYVKAFRWASDRLGREGIVAYVSNNGFVEGIAADGMRKHLARDFDTIYLLDLGGNVRKNPKLSGTTHNVFGIQVGVSVAFLVRRSSERKKAAEIHYHAVPVDWRKEQKFAFLNKAERVGGVEWKSVTPDRAYHWLTVGEDSQFGAFLPIATKDAKANVAANTPVVFRDYSRGITTSRDDWMFAFDASDLAAKAKRFIANYNSELTRYREAGRPRDVEAFVRNDASFVKWTDRLKSALSDGEKLKFARTSIRRCLYRPFTSEHVYFDDLLTHRRYHQHRYFPDSAAKNLVICLTDIGGRSNFSALASDRIPDLHLCASVDTFQCFPFYTYDGEHGAQRENIPLSTLVRFQNHYVDEAITKWDIFHYVYAVLHHPEYRTRYAANLRRELPRLPLLGKDAKTFYTYAGIGKKLADLHVHYESAAEHPLRRVENPDEPLNWRVEKMRLTRDKTALVYNEFLTLVGIPESAFAYRLGNRSALEWVIDQYEVHTDRRSGITNDPNREDEPDYIVKLIGKVITVSVETQKLIASLPPLEIAESAADNPA